jgi:6-pyruvoyl-tetrahydropterin synthase
MEIQFLGHAALYIKTSTHNILVDPFISGNPKASLINIQDLNPHVILLTHAHQDHILDVEKIAKANNALIVSNFEIVSHFQNKGLNGHPMNHGGKWTFDFGELKKIVKTEIVDLLDHSISLNKEADYKSFIGVKDMFDRIHLLDYQPTCENMVVDFASKIKPKLPIGVELYSIKLHETATSYAEWYAEDN